MHHWLKMLLSTVNTWEKVKKKMIDGSIPVAFPKFFCHQLFSPAYWNPLSSPIFLLSLWRMGPAHHLYFLLTEWCIGEEILGIIYTCKKCRRRILMGSPLHENICEKLLGSRGLALRNPHVSQKDHEIVYKIQAVELFLPLDWNASQGGIEQEIPCMNPLISRKIRIGNRPIGAHVYIYEYHNSYITQWIAESNKNVNQISSSISTHSR